MLPPLVIRGILLNEVVWMHGCETLPKYVSRYKKDGRTFYRLRKNYKKQEIQVVQHPSLDYVLRCRTECEKAGWDKEKILELKNKFNLEKPLRDSQYIYKDDKGGWRIAKWEKGRVRYYAKSRYYPEAVKIRDYLVEHNWKKPILHKRSVSPNKYLHRAENGKYYLRKGGKTYGTYDSWLEAVRMRNKLIENGWDNSIVHYKRGANNPYRYISVKEYKGKKSYHVKKMINDENVHFSTCSSLEEAVRERDFWESINWDFDLLDLH